MKSLITISILFASAFSFAQLEEPYNLKGSIEVKEFRREVKKIKDLEIDVAGVDVNNKIVDVLLNDEEYQLLQDEGFDVEITWVKGVSFDQLVDPEYKNPYEIEQFMQTANGLFPELTELVKIGESLEGRSIWALKITDNPTKRELEEPTVLFNSMHHAREVMTPEVSLDVIEYLLSNYGNDSKVTNWVDSNEIWVVPMLNVDGNNQVWQGNTMWRKNTRNGHGVDLNRNYPFGWNGCNGSSGSTSADDYRGPSPASEPETQALMGLVEKIKPVFDISYHSYSELVLYPYGCRNSQGAPSEVMETVGKELGRLLGYRAGTPWEILYEADGSDIDWMLGEHQVIPYVFELNSRSDGFQPRYSTTRDRTVELNRKGWMHLLDRLDESGIRGVVPASLQSGYDFIKVFKAGKLIQKYKVNPDGTFHIVLNPGAYSFEFSFAEGFNQDLKIQDKRIDLKF